MSAEDDDEKALQKLEEWNARVAAGEPIWTFDMHEVLDVQFSPEGWALIDFVFAGSTESQAVVARLLVSPESASTLKAALVANESIPDTSPPKRGQRPKQ